MTKPVCGKVVVFFTRGMSLEEWHRVGILDRELAIYRALAERVEGLAFLTYGGPGDCQWAAGLPGVEILPNRWGLAPNLYSMVAPWLHRRTLRHASIFKTNQINGAWCAVIAHALFRKALVVRCGFLWADFVERLTTSRWRRVVARAIERVVMRTADRIIVAAEADASAIADRYGISRSMIIVSPNYVDTRTFRPLPDATPESGRIAFVGRLEPQKNLEALIDALRDLRGVVLVVAGDGSLRESLQDRARANNVTVEFAGRVPNTQVPALLRRSEVFVLPSHYEGNPKALVEAMACGVPVVGARSPGIREVVADGDTGLLCGSSAADIRSAVVEILNNAPLRARLRAGGLRYVKEHCSLEIAVARECALLASLGAV